MANEHASNRASSLWWRARSILLGYVLPVLLLGEALQWIVRMGLALRLMPILPPDWWFAGSAKLLRIFSWLHVNTGLGLVIALLPVAIGLVVFAPRRGLRLALIVTALMIVTHPMLQTFLPQWSTLDALGRASVVADLVKQALTLPALTWVCGRLLAPRRLGGTGRARSPMPVERRPEGTALMGLAALPAAAALPLFFLLGPEGQDPLRWTLWDLMGRSFATGLLLGAPLLAGLALLTGTRGPARRLVLATAPLLIGYGVLALALESIKPMILARIKAPLPAPPLWNLELFSMGSWALLAAGASLLLAWALAMKLVSGTVPEHGIIGSATRSCSPPSARST
jgi:hypothetical protein